MDFDNNISIYEAGIAETMLRACYLLMKTKVPKSRDDVCLQIVSKYAAFFARRGWLSLRRVLRPLPVQRFVQGFWNCQAVASIQIYLWQGVKNTAPTTTGGIRVAHHTERKL